MIEKNLHKGGKIIYIENFISQEDSVNLIDHLLSEINWIQDKYTMYGKEVLTPRKLSSMMDNNFKAQMVGKVWNENTAWVKAGKEWTDPVEKIRKRIEDQITQKISYAQLNHYKTCNDYIGWHTDSETADGDLIASISLGATRRFLLREKHKKNGPEDYEFTLKNGSLFIFDSDAAKKYYKHCLPKMRKKDNYTDQSGNGRINITFRIK